MAESPLAGLTETAAKVRAQRWIGVRGPRAGNHSAVGYRCGGRSPGFAAAFAPCCVEEHLLEEGGGASGSGPAELHGGVIGGVEELGNGGLPLAEVPSFLPGRPPGLRD